MEKLTQAKLTKELEDWQKVNGNGRDRDHLRFGQYIWCKYNMKEIFPDPDSAIDGFSDENPNNAYNKIMSKLITL